MATTKKRVLVTGANGAIGRVLMERLADRYDLRALTRTEVEFPSHIADVSDLVAILPAFEGIDAVVHMAGSSAVDSPWEAVLQSNLIGAYHIFEAARIAKVPAVVFASSNHAIGEYELEGAPDLYRLDDPRVYDHTVEVRPDSLYGVSKIYGEALGRFYHDRYGIRVYNLRIGSMLEDDDPRSPAIARASSWLKLEPAHAYARYRATWLSQRDCAELVACCIDAEDVDWAVVYGISDNPRQFWDITHAFDLLGYTPEDSAPIGEEP